MIDRIKSIQEYFGLTPTQFADKIELNRSNLTHIYSGRNHPSLDVAKKILNTFPEINSDWLIMGNGTMFKGQADSVQYDLFSTVESQPKELEGKKEEFQPERVIEKKRQQQRKVENITSRESNNVGVESAAIDLSHSQRDKKIEKMIILYEDGTFSIYFPQ